MRGGIGRVLRVYSSKGDDIVAVGGNYSGNGRVYIFLTLENSTVAIVELGGGVVEPGSKLSASNR
jgi:hypothetical protein